MQWSRLRQAARDAGLVSWTLIQASTARGLSEARRLEDLRGDHVRVHVAGGPAVLEVALLLRLRVPRDADGRAAVCHAVGESRDGGRLVGTREAALVACAVDLDVLLVLGAQLLDGLDDLVVAARCPHGCRGVV